MSRFLEALQSGRVLLMDGAMGTELQCAGMPSGTCYELWNLKCPEDVRAIHRSYVAASAEVLLTHTFQANPIALARFGLRDQTSSILTAALENARTAGPGCLVVGDIGPLPEEDALEAVRKVAFELRDADALLLETWSDPVALWAAQYGCQAARELGGLPVLLSMTYQRHPSGALVTASGHPPEWFARLAKEDDVAALGVNCGRDIGMDEIIEIVRRYRAVTNLPLFARPNAGTPVRDGERWIYPHTPQQMATRLPELLEAGVCMVGGCCGTTPEHIAAFRTVIDEWNTRDAHR
jgi:methionine synthase I (cobalamin-dependent)